jgi:hypothetical protein
LVLFTLCQTTTPLLRSVVRGQLSKAKKIKIGASETEYPHPYEDCDTLNLGYYRKMKVPLLEYPIGMTSFYDQVQLPSVSFYTKFIIIFLSLSFTPCSNRLSFI